MPAPSETRRDRQDLKLGIARGMGMTLEKAAEFAGCSLRKAGYKVKESDVIEIIQWVEMAKEQQISVADAISRDKYNEHIEELLSYCKGVLEKALKSEDLGLALKAVKQIEDRLLGSPTQKVESKNLTAHIEVVQIPEGAMNVFFDTVKEYRALMSGNDDVIEAELLDE